MKLLEIPVTLSERVQFLFQPLVVDVQQRSGSQLTEENRLAWQRIIDGKVTDWARDSSQLDEEDLEPPSAETLSRVVEIANVLRNNGVDPPLRVVPNGEGGVVFEWRNNAFLWALEMEKGGALALSVFFRGRLASRHQLL